MRMTGEGLPIPMEAIVDASSVPDKDELKKQKKAAAQAPPPKADPALLAQKHDTAVEVAHIAASGKIEGENLHARTAVLGIQSEQEMHAHEVAEGVGRGAPLPQRAPGAGAPGSSVNGGRRPAAPPGPAPAPGPAPMGGRPTPQ